jgi:N-sulfoglucosamine sulfohydrolase
MSRKQGPHLMLVMVTLGALPGSSLAQPSRVAGLPARPNILLITVDDMNWDSPGCFGSAVQEITPNIDRLASEGIRFRNAHVTVAVCTPSRSVLLTGMYPHQNVAEGFQRIRADVPTLPAVLGAAGYLCGTMGKWLGQQEVFNWAIYRF